MLLRHDVIMPLWRWQAILLGGDDVALGIRDIVLVLLGRVEVVPTSSRATLAEKLLPGCEGLGREDPGGRADPNAENRDVLEQEGSEGRGNVRTAVSGGPSVPTRPDILHLPVVLPGELVQEEDK